MDKSNNNLKKGIYRKCNGCKTVIYVISSKINKNTFCSILCANKNLHTTSVLKNCTYCDKEISIPKARLTRSKNHFCSKECANIYQGRNKVEFDCVLCGNKFRVSKSEVEKSNKRGHKKQYCSMVCRNNDKERMTEKAQIMNRLQLEKKGLNKLELAGREWLENSLGFQLNVDFEEQVLMFKKFCVDVVFLKYKLIIQFDGEYWHTQERRMKLDKSQDAYFRKCGYLVFRITDKEMYSKDKKKHKELILRFTKILQAAIIKNSHQ